MISFIIEKVFNLIHLLKNNLRKSEVFLETPR